MAGPSEHVDDEVRLIHDHLEKINVEYEFNFSDIKEEQRTSIVSIVQKRDTLAVLPTGFGKTFCIVAPILIMKKLHPDIKHCGIVISPLIALMKDHVQWLTEHKIDARMLSSDMSNKDKRAVTKGQATVLFTSPEALVHGQWRGVVPRVYGERCAIVAYDEAHCISEWGSDFRPDYKRVSEVQNIICATTLALTATATTSVVKDIEKELCLTNYTIVSSLPDRPNIFLEKKVVTEQLSNLSWVVDEVRGKGAQCKKIVIYVNYVTSTAKIYEFFSDELDDDMYVDGSIRSDTRLIDMYSSGSHPKDQEAVLDRFRSGRVRVLIATVAFGMGVNIPDIDIVVHWGLPRTSLMYWQQCGRAGRDGRDALSFLYIFPRSIHLCNDTKFKDHAKNMGGCLRLTTLMNFNVTEKIGEQLENLKRHRQTCQSGCSESTSPVCCKCSYCTCCLTCMKECPCAKDCNSKLDYFLS